MFCYLYIYNMHIYIVVSTQPRGPSAMHILHTFINPYTFLYKFQSYALNLKPYLLPSRICPGLCLWGAGKTYNRQTTWDKENRCRNTTGCYIYIYEEQRGISAVPRIYRYTNPCYFCIFYLFLFCV